MTDYSRDNQGTCRRHGRRVAVDEGCDLCDAEEELRPTCGFCYKRLTDDEILNFEYFCEACSDIAEGEADPERNEP